MSMNEKNNDQLGTNQDADVLHRMLDTQRWLMNNGFSNDIIKDQIFMFGSVVHKNVEAVEAKIDPEKKVVSYDLYLSSSLLKKHMAFLKLRTEDSLMSLWRFKRLLKKEGNLDFSKLINNFITDYLGPKWASEVNVKNVSDYSEDYERTEEQAESSHTTDQQSD